MLNRHLPERYDTFCIHSSNQQCLRPQTAEAHGFCPADAAKIKKQQTQKTTAPHTSAGQKHERKFS